MTSDVFKKKEVPDDVWISAPRLANALTVCMCSYSYHIIQSLTFINNKPKLIRKTLNYILYSVLIPNK